MNRTSQQQDQDIKKYFVLVKRKQFLFAATAGLIISLAIAVSYLIPPLYEARTVVSVEKSTLNEIVKSFGNPQSGEDKAKALSTFMKSRTLVSSVMNDLGMIKSGMNDLQIESLIKGTQDRTDINVEYTRPNRKDIDYFVVSFRSRSAATARDYVNSLVSRYIEEALHTKREGSFGANRFLLDQITQMLDTVTKLDAEIADLKKSQTILFYARYSELQKKLDDLLIQYTDTHPEVLRLKKDIESLKIKYREASAAGDGAKNGASISNAAELMNKLVALEEKRKTANKAYEDLSAAYHLSEMSAQAEIQDKAGSFRIVDPAVIPVKPSSPNRVRIILFGVCGGIAGAFFLLVLLDRADQSIRDADDLSHFGIPMLGMIGHIEPEQEVRRARYKSRFLYGLSGLFAALVMTVIARELFL